MQQAVSHLQPTRGLQPEPHHAGTMTSDLTSTTVRGDDSSGLDVLALSEKNGLYAFLIY